MNEREIFFAALELPADADRQAFLDEMCDPALRERIERLLQQRSQLGSFLEHPPVGDLLAEPDATILSGANSTCNASDSVGPDTMGRGPGKQDDEIALTFLQPTTRPDSLGRLAHYEILEVIGRGAFGTVLKAFDEKLQRVVAIKVLALELAAASPARKRFLREARASAQVRHENVVSIHNVEDEPLPYLVMEFIPGETLQKRLDARGPLDLLDVLRLGKQIADGLAAAHAQDLIHRDVKPGNILLDTSIDDRVKITDFGLARTADDASMTQSGIIAGTPLYMAPEQALGHKLDQRADLFSFGGVLYQMLSGRPPFRAPSTIAVLKRVIEDTPRPIREIIPETPDWMCELVGHLLAKQPGERYDSAKEVSKLLATCLADVERGRLPKVPAPGPMANEAIESAMSFRGAEKPQCRAAQVRARQPMLRIVALALVVLLAGLGITEATGVTHLAATVIRLATGSGTLVIETDDPGIHVTVNGGGDEVTIRGASVEQLTLRPGEYQVAASKDGKPVKQELVSITRNGRTVVRMGLESVGGSAAPIRPAQVPQQADFALKFEGDGDYVRLPTLAYKGDTPVTFEARVRIDEDRAGLQRVIACGWGGFQVLRDRNVRFAAWNSQPGESIELISPSAIRSGIDTHIAISWDGVEYRLFINGELVARKQDRAYEIVNGQGFTFGADSGDQADGFLHGVLDEVRVSNIARYTENFTPQGRFETDGHTLALYHFDEGSGDVLNDSSGNGHHGKIVGAKWVRSESTSLSTPAFPLPADAPPPTRETYALDFHGHSYVDTPVQVSMDQPFTLEAWATPRSWDSSRLCTVISDADDSGASLELSTSGFLSWGFSVHDQQSYRIARTNQFVEQNRRVHLAGVFDGTRCKLFVDGQLTAAAPVPQLPLRPSNLPLMFGANPEGVGAHPIYHFDGVIDEVRISQTARYAEKFTPSERFEPDEHTLALYHFDEGSGDVLKDSSGNGHHGKIVGAKWVRSERTSLSTPAFPWPADAPPPAIAPFDAEQAKAHQQAWSKYLGVPVEMEIVLGQDKDGKDVALTMVFIPPGEFLMGSTDEEQARFLEEARLANDTWAINRIPGEGPQHWVRISWPFWLSQQELTIAQFRRFAEAAEYKTDAEQDGLGGFGIVDGNCIQAPQFVWNGEIGFPQTDHHPAVNISWNDSAAFCQWLSQEQNGWTFTLPTEAQREYACRAGTTTYWHCGDNADELPEYGWFQANSGDRSHPVGQLKPNAFGLYDMHGNAWEWCADYDGANYYAISPESDPGGPAAGLKRMHRGGGWDAIAGVCRSANRAEVEASWRTCVFGFRVAATLPDDVLRVRFPPLDSDAGPLNTDSKPPPGPAVAPLPAPSFSSPPE